MKKYTYSIYLFLVVMMMSCTKSNEQLSVEVYETSANGNSLTKLSDFSSDANQEEIIQIKLLPAQKRQIITGFGGSFTESSAYLLNQLS